MESNEEDRSSIHTNSSVDLIVNVIDGLVESDDWKKGHGGGLPPQAAAVGATDVDEENRHEVCWFVEVLPDALLMMTLSYLLDTTRRDILAVSVCSSVTRTPALSVNLWNLRHSAVNPAARIPRLMGVLRAMFRWFNGDHTRRHFVVSECPVMLRHLADSHGSLGDADRQRLLAGKAEDFARKFDLGDAVVATAMSCRANAINALGDAKGARLLLEAAYKIQRATPNIGEDHIAYTLTGLGSVCVDLGDLDAAVSHLTRALEINERLFGPNHTIVAGTLVTLGDAYGSMGQSERQLPLATRALEIRESHAGAGKGQLEISCALVSLANASADGGDCLRAKRLLERALAVDEKYLGMDHRDVAATLVNLGGVNRELNNAAEAREQLERALVITEREYGADHPDVAYTLTNLGDALLDLAQPARAAELLQRALDISIQNFGIDHAQIVPCLRCLGIALSDLNRLAEAEEHLVRALEIGERAFGLEHPDVADTLVSLGLVHEAVRASEVTHSQFDDRERRMKDAWRRALAIRTRHYGAMHNHTLWVNEELAHARAVPDGFPAFFAIVLESADASGSKHWLDVATADIIGHARINGSNSCRAMIDAASPDELAVEILHVPDCFTQAGETQVVDMGTARSNYFCESPLELRHGRARAIAVGDRLDFTAAPELRIQLIHSDPHLRLHFLFRVVVAGDGGQHHDVVMCIMSQPHGQLQAEEQEEEEENVNG